MPAPQSGADRTAASVARRGAVTRRTCADPARRKRLEANPLKWLKHYMPNAYSRPFERPQKEIVSGVTTASDTGGRLIIAEERGVGKSVVLWGLNVYLSFTGQQPFPVCIPWAEKDLKRAFRFWRNALCFNPLLAADYPEFCDPFVHSKGVPQRVQTTTWADNGDPTGAQLTIGEGMIVLPDGRGCFGGGTIGASVRGLNLTLPDGTVLRPTLALCDDIQSRKVAQSPKQVEDTIETINGDIAGLGEAGKDIPIVMACNCIDENDVPAHYLDDPGWVSLRIPCIEQWPKGWEDERSECRKLWKEWCARWHTKDGEQAYFRKHRKVMLDGIKLSAPSCYVKKGSNLPAGYWAMVTYHKMGEAAFAAEKQQKPLKASSSTYTLTPQIILSRESGYNRLCAPSGSQVVMAVDINYIGLNWVIMAADKLTSSRKVLGHGLWTGGPRVMIKSGVTDDTARALIRKALGVFIRDIVNPTRVIVGNVPTKISHVCFDAGNGKWHFDVIAALREARSTSMLFALKGFPDVKYRPQRDDLRSGMGWRIANWKRDDLGNIFVINSDHWRKNMQEGWLVEPTEAGAMSLYAGSHGEHKELAAQIAGEKLIEHVTTGKGEYYKWARTPGILNDKADATYYACALLSMLGIGEPLQQTQAAGPRKRRKVRHVSI